MKNFKREPVWKSKEYIWKYFQNSGKKHLFITGKRQIGKTTFLGSILELGLDYGGIITRAIREGNNIPNTVLLEDIHNAAVNSIVGCRNELNNAIIPCLEGFEKYGVSILNSYLNSEAAWIVIDEIGFLESNASIFQQTIRSCLQHKRVIAVLSKRSTPFLEELYSWPEALLIDLDDL